MTTALSDAMAIRKPVRGRATPKTRQIPKMEGVHRQKDPQTMTDEHQPKETGQPPSMEHCNEKDGSSISISSRSKLAVQTVAPFLAKHIPAQYNPLGGAAEKSEKAPNTKYCYRHRPDVKCRRTVNEPSMKNLQRELERLSQSDQQGISHVWSLFSAAPAKQRNLMLQGILTQCCFPQLSYLSAAVRDLIRIDFLTALPSEIAFTVLCFLDTTSLCKAAQVSQKWRMLADDDIVWHKMCEQHIDRKCTKCGWGLPLLERKMLRHWKRQQQLRASGRGLNEWSPDLPLTPEIEATAIPTQSTVARLTNKRNLSNMITDDGPSEAPKRQCTGRGGLSIGRPKFRPWKDVYKDRFKVGTNWKYGRCKMKVFRGHTNGVMCLQFDDTILATGSYDCTIKIWDIKTGDCLRTLRGHTSAIRALQFDDTKLISGSLDKELKLWNWRTGDCLNTFTGHTGGIICLHFEDNLLASGSIDKSIKIWNFKEQHCYCLRGHGDWVNAVKIDSASRTLFSASDDCTVRLWDLDTRSTIRTFDGHVGQVQQVVILPIEYEPEDTLADEHDDTASSSASITGALPTMESFDAWPDTRPPTAHYIVSGALDDTIRLWDVHTGKCLKTFFGHVEGVWALAADMLRVVSGAQDRMVKVWDARTGKCERTFTGHTGPVTCIGLSDSRMCTGSEDAEVRMYGFESMQENEGDPVGEA